MLNQRTMTTVLVTLLTVGLVACDGARQTGGGTAGKGDGDCPPERLSDDGFCAESGQLCADDEVMNEDGQCEPSDCPPERLSDDGSCTESGQLCADDEVMNEDGQCEPSPCGPDEMISTDGCVAVVVDPPGGFGAACDVAASYDVVAAPQCAAGLHCVAIEGGTESKGFCTKECTNPGNLCEDQPAGTLAVCNLGDGDGPTYCAFLCAYGGYDFKCSGTGMTCGDEQPPESGQKYCIP